jgi:hypothetical protein
MTTPSADAIRLQLEKPQQRVLQLDPIVIAYFGDFSLSLRGILEKKIKKIISDSQPRCIDQSKPKCGPDDSCTEIVCRFE